jgi:hypothetical protein
MSAFGRPLPLTYLEAERLLSVGAVVQSQEIIETAGEGLLYFRHQPVAEFALE